MTKIRGVLGGAMILAWSAASAAAHEPPEPRRFRFDGGFEASACLRFEFTRPAPTRDLEGRLVAPNEPRYRGPMLLASAPETEVVRPIPSALILLASGFDSDGVTPLMVVYQANPRLVDVFTVANGQMAEAERTGQGRNRTEFPPGRPDIMLGRFPGRAYAPKAGTICHGLIVLACDVTADHNGEWLEEGVAFVASQDQGRTWQLLLDDSPVQVRKTRLREWSMQSWWPLAYGANPLECWVVATDYRTNPSSTGGRFYICRAERPAVGAAWTIGPVVRAYEQIGTWDEHFHTATLTPLGSGLRALVAIGDGQDINRIVSLTRADRNYADLQGWTAQERYHGSKEVPGMNGNQFVGAAPGPALDQVLAGSDQANEQIMLLTLTDPHPRTRWLYGTGWADGRRTANFVIRKRRPEFALSDYVCRYDPDDANVDNLYFPRRGLYSPDGLLWAQAFSPLTDKNWTVLPHGDHIYYDRSGPPNEGLYRVGTPVVYSARPLEIGPGGRQRLAPSARVDRVFNGEIVPLQRDAFGRWTDGGTVLSPQPPCEGPVFRVRASRFDPQTRVGDLLPAGDGAGFGEALGTDAVNVRLWVCNIAAHKSARPTINVRSSGAPLRVGQQTRVHVTDAWMPLTFSAELPVAPTDRLLVGIHSGGEQPDDEDFYLALECATEGPAFPGYPMPHDATRPPGGTDFPDELARVRSFACGPAWSVTLAGELPWNGWDGSVAGVRRMPLATLWGDDRNYILLEAESDRLAGVLRARVVRDGAEAAVLESDRVWWLRGSPVLVSLADAGDGLGVRVTLSAGGLSLGEAAIAPPFTGSASPGVAPREVRFGDPTGQSGTGLVQRVAPMVWWGGRIDERSALDQAERRALLLTLSFLREPIVGNADLDGDGAFTIFDFLRFQNLFQASDPRADFDRDGVWTVFDFLAFQNAFAVGCP